MSATSSYANVNGVPQSLQNPRIPEAELRNAAGRPRVHTTSAFGSLASAAKGPPTAFWHMRQWQTLPAGAESNA